MSNSVYKMVLEFKERHPWTIGWRLRQNSKVVELHLNPDEKVLFVCCGQHSPRMYDFFVSCVVAITTQRILIGTKRLFFGFHHHRK